MGLFRRKQKPAPAPEPHGVYVWIDGIGPVIRLFFVGNNRSFSPRDQLSIDGKEELARVIRQLNEVLEDYSMSGVRMYANYVALPVSYYSQEKSVDDVIGECLRALADYLEWESIPIIEEIDSMDEYLALNRKFGGRWSLGAR